MKSFKIGNTEIKLPIIQGGMGIGVSLAGLASAVANEGGVGVISAAGLGLIHGERNLSFIENNNWGIQEEIRMAREKTKGVIGINIMVALTNFADIVRTSIAEKVDIIFSGAGLPLDLPSYLKPDSVTKLVPIVSSSRAAKLICNKWKNNYNYLPDAIVVEGPKAGGHLGFKIENLDDEHFALEEIVPEVIEVANSFKEEKEIPVIAAGGIYTGKDIRRFLDMGAAGVQMGTIFVTTKECDASETFKNEYIKAKREDLRIIHSPVGMPGRALDGEFIQKVEAGVMMPKACPFHCLRTCDYVNAPYCISQALFQAAKGNLKRVFVFAGFNAYLAEKITSVKEVIASLKAEFLLAKGN
jgi:NAD(P)H-dependent flavin oxidoreductase YrpB (nitropropane dioxygenase family)